MGMGRPGKDAYRHCRQNEGMQGAHGPARSLSRRPIALVERIVTLPNFRRPPALDVAEDRPDIPVRKFLPERRHRRRRLRTRRFQPAVFRYLEQELIRMMPGVAARVVRRRGKAAVREPLAPVGHLSLEVPAMAGSAFLRIDRRTARRQFGVPDVYTRHVSAGPKPKPCRGRDGRDRHGDKNEYASFCHVGTLPAGSRVQELPDLISHPLTIGLTSPPPAIPWQPPWDATVQ